MPAITRILAVGAMQGNEAVWRTFVNVVALDVYKIDRAVVIGELGGGDEEAVAPRAGAGDLRRGAGRRAA